jgi:hypothetical protein
MSANRYVKVLQLSHIVVRRRIFRWIDTLNISLSIQWRVRIRCRIRRRLGRREGRI